jgi:hypothetical protein
MDSSHTARNYTVSCRTGVGNLLREKCHFCNILRKNFSENHILYRMFLNYVSEIGELQDVNMNQTGPMDIGAEMLL